MNIIKKHSYILPFFYIVLMALSLSFTSCKDDDNTSTDPSLTTDPAIDKLEALISEITDLDKSSTYGLRTDMYPEESKTILTNAISNANRYILLIKYSNPAPTQSEKDNFVTNVQAAIPNFESTIRTEDAPTKDAYLYVNGNKGGYIDFGYSPDYVTFGDQGNQSFTVEFWVKITGYYTVAGQDNSMMLNTYVDDKDNSNNNSKSGWNMYSRNNNGTRIVRLGTGYIDTNSNNKNGLWESAFNYSGLDEWMHYAIVYSDKGLDGDAGKRSKLYKNGVYTGSGFGIGETYRVYNSVDADLFNVPMTAFVRKKRDGSSTEAMDGYIRKIRIWKTAKDASYIQASKEGTATLDPQDPNLVCGWDFEKASYDNEILDITGRHTAKLVGEYKWEDR